MPSSRQHHLIATLLPTSWRHPPPQSGIAIVLSPSSLSPRLITVIVGPSRSKMTISDNKQGCPRSNLVVAKNICLRPWWCVSSWLSTSKICLVAHPAIFAGGFVCHGQSRHYIRIRRRIPAVRRRDSKVASCIVPHLLILCCHIDAKNCPTVVSSLCRTPASPSVRVQHGEMENCATLPYLRIKQIGRASCALFRSALFIATSE